MINKVESAIEHAETHCKAHGTRLTEKRKHVLRGLLSSDHALSAYELIDLLKNQFNEQMPATSMYRILDFLEKEHLVHKLNSTNKYIACEHIVCEHTHEVPQFLICNECQIVKEISIGKDLIEKLNKKIEDSGFQLIKPQFEMSCVCDSCR